MVSPAKPPDHHRPPTPSPIIQPLVVHQSSPSSKLPIDFSPPLIAMVVIAAAAFLFVTYSRLLSRLLFRPFLRLLRRRPRPRPRPSLPSFSTFESPPYDPSDGFFVYSPYGLDESVIKTIPLTIYNSKLSLDCAVCLLEFEEEDYIRTLPICSHSFHVDCIDMWLRSHASCPLCRAGVVPAGSPLAPIMAGRIRPSLDEEGLLLENILLQYLPEGPSPEITPAVDDQIQTEDRNVRRDFVLKRSYSFGFERSFPSERLLVTEPVTASPWRGHRRGGFWSSKRPSPFGSVTKSRVFSFRYKGVKSPFFRRRGGFIPLGYSGGGGSSRPSKAAVAASPVEGRAGVSSSRMRCGDPEALLSPERYGRT